MCDEIDSLQTLLGEARAELLIAKEEVTQLKEQLSFQTQRADEATRILNAGLEELKRAGEQAYKLLEGLEKQLAAGDALRVRLAKATRMVELAGPYIQELESGGLGHDLDKDPPALQEARRAYVTGLIEYNKPDG